MLERVLHSLFNPRQRSLVRGNLLVAGSLLLALRMADFPANRANPFLLLPLLLALAGTLDTARNMRRRWNWYHGGVVLCIYADLMILSMIAFFLIYPYGVRLAGGR